MHSNLTRLLPGWPVVPPRLWLTAGLWALAVVNLIFLEEVWPHTPSAKDFLFLVLLGTVLAGCCQLVMVLHAWLVDYMGPWWAKVLLRIIVIPAIVGCVSVALVDFLFLLFCISNVLDKGFL